MSPQKFSIQEKLMGCSFELAVVSDEEDFAREQLELGIREIRRLEDILSEFKPHADTWEINQKGASQSVKVHPETFELIRRCQSISQLTQGYFDITTATLKTLYRFNNTDFTFPSEERITNLLQHAGYHHIQVDDHQKSISLTGNQTKISFAAIGKGFSSDHVKKLWIENGVKKGYVNASGDMNVFITEADLSPWKVAIAHPDKSQPPLLTIPLRNFSVATSGDYEQFFIHNGVRYSHNLNPVSGKPVTGVNSVTVLSPSAELSDALATAVTAMGVSRGIDFINQLPQTHALIMDDKNNLHLSKKVRMTDNEGILC
jgi:thiamine biosynthesis lipoprotein